VVLSVRQDMVSYIAHILDKICAYGLPHFGRNKGGVIENRVLKKLL
jgi:hypothetical protein